MGHWKLGAEAGLCEGVGGVPREGAEGPFHRGLK